MKFTDEMVMKIVAEECAPFEVNGVMVSGGAIARTDLVRRITALGVSQTPAYNRIEKLVNAGLLVEGNSPFDSQKRGIHVWLPKQEADSAVEDATSKSNVRNSEVLEIVRSLAPDAEHPMPLRAMHREKGEAAGMSFTGFYRAVQGLLEAKLVAFNDSGYYAVTATQMEVDV
jgi:hypothetical protein